MNEILSQLVKKIKPKNGLIVNANVWEEAHHYHELHHRAHLVYSHGAGIITGLEVEPGSDATRVWVKPGMAVDCYGRLIVLDKQQRETLSGDHPGMVYLYLAGADEREVKPDNGTSQSSLHHVRTGYILTSAYSLPDDAIELARIRLTGAKANIRAAKDRTVPVPDELDLRFRRGLNTPIRRKISMGIAYLGQPGETGPEEFGRRAGHLATAISHLIQHDLFIDDNVNLEDGLQSHTMVYLVEREETILTPGQEDALRAHLHQGGTLLIDSYVNPSPLFGFINSLGIDFTVNRLDDILVNPFLFSVPPPGANQAGGRVQVQQGVIFSTYDYCRVWQRIAGDDPLRSREVIRAATEFAADIVVYAITRRQNSLL